MSPRQPDLPGAADFVWRSARLVDRVRFAHLFSGGAREAVLAALRAYQNADGGFGHALEPDLRAPASQPGAIRTAFEMLDQVGGFADPMVTRACEYLPTITTAEGGLPFALPSAGAYPHAPWWQPDEDPPASPTFTAPIAGLLHKHRIAHPWLDRATEYCWRQVAALEAAAPPGPAWDVARIERSYEARALLAFLEHAPDRRRAEEAVGRIGRLVLEQGLVELDPGARGEVHTPLDYAPRPDAPARPLFADRVIDAHLDALAAAQQPDGGWTFRWAAWSPGATIEWRGWLTVETLLVFREYGRLPRARLPSA